VEAYSNPLFQKGQSLVFLVVFGWCWKTLVFRNFSQGKSQKDLVGRVGLVIFALRF
jgi:hypothetical protein